LLNGYTYGFNGQEKDDEVYGSGNLNTAEYWEYDTRLGRRWNLDPIVNEQESPYACFANNPIWIIDVDGKDSSLYNNANGKLIAKGVTPEDDKTAIWTVNTRAKDYDKDNPWKTAEKLTYNVGTDADKKAHKTTGITGNSFRSNHPLFSKRQQITGNYAMQYQAQVYEEDLMDMTTEFLGILKNGESHFAPTTTGPWKLWFYYWDIFRLL
jgi:RHS repeat-associated protein